MNNLPDRLFAPSQVRELDRRAIEDYGIAGYVLMTRAGQYAYGIGRERWGKRRIVAICGAGNNAGDGYVIARLAIEAGAEAEVVYLVDPERLSGDAATAARDFSAAGGIWRPFDGDLSGTDVVIVDALLGTGLDRPVGGRFAEAVEAINRSSAPVLAVDVPSGLNAGTGAVMGTAVHADVTATFVGMKTGLLTGHGPDHCGDIFYDSLGVPEEVFDGIPVKARLIADSEMRRRLGPRPRDAHKGLSGHVLIVGGGEGMPGAARLAGEAALRAGAGLVSVATRPEHVAAVVAGRPELMCRGIRAGDDLASLLDRATVVAIGPGLGQTDWSRMLLDLVLSTEKPLVADADALNLIAARNDARSNWILTPHPGEAARLLDTEPAAVQEDRFQAVEQISRNFHAVTVLKGAGSLVCDCEGGISLCPAGNPGMAVAGMGDVLTGVIAALVAQGLELTDAARLGVLVHARAGDEASRVGERGMTASDLFPWIRRHVNP